MALSDKEKSEARDALSLALELNEPETMIEGLKRLCVKKAQERHMSDNERARWQSAHQALTNVASELEARNAPHAPKQRSDESMLQDRHLEAIKAADTAREAPEAPGEHKPDS